MDAHKDKALKQKYSLALMSNHKWRKLFMVMAENGSDFSGIEYHFTDTEKVLYGNAPLASQIWAEAIDDPVEGIGGPVEYKHIESILIPYVYSYRTYENSPITSREQDLVRFVEALDKVGRFPIMDTEKGIVIHGYKK